MQRYISQLWLLFTPHSTSGSDQTRGTALRSGIILTVLTLLAFTLRLYKLDYVGYWDDEVITTFAARPPIPEIFTSIANYSVHPPFYYALLHVWMALFGEELWTIRLLSVLISTTCVPLIYLLGRELTSKPVALVAAAIMSIAPFHVFHGQQARMYPLLTLLVMFAVLCFVRAWRNGGWMWWLGYGVCVAAGCYTHIYFFFSVAAINAWAVYTTYEQRSVNVAQWSRLIIVQVVALLAFLPFVPQLFGTVQGVVQWYWIGQATAFDWMFALLSLSNNATAPQTSHVSPVDVITMYVPGVAVVLLTLVYSLREARRHPAERSVWVLLHLLLWTPIAIGTLISLTIKPILLDRSLIGISPALYLLVAWMFVRFWRVKVVQFVALGFVLSCCASLAYSYPNVPRQNSLVELTRYLANEQQPDDAIVFADWQAFDTALLTQPQLENVYILASPARSAVQFAGQKEWEERLAYMRWHSPQNVQPVAAFASDYQRVWLVFTLYTPNLEYQREVNQAWLEQQGRHMQTLDFEQAMLWLYEITPTAALAE